MSGKAGVQLTTAQGLTIPSMSGSEVKTTLGEMDALRASAANAIKVAQELESQQGLVRIEVSQTFREPQYNHFENDNWGSSAIASSKGFAAPPISNRGFVESGFVDRKHVISVTIVNLETIMAELRKETNFLLEETHKAEVTSLETLNQACQDKLKAANDRYYDCEKTLVAIRGKLSDKTRQANGFSDTVDKLMAQIEEYKQTQASLVTLTKDYAEVVVAYNKLSKRKTFWGWLYSKVNKEDSNA